MTGFTSVPTAARSLISSMLSAVTIVNVLVTIKQTVKQSKPHQPAGTVQRTIPLKPVRKEPLTDSFLAAQTAVMVSLTEKNTLTQHSTATAHPM